MIGMNEGMIGHWVGHKPKSVTSMYTTPDSDRGQALYKAFDAALVAAKMKPWAPTPIY